MFSIVFKRICHDVTVRSVNESGTAVNCSGHDGGQVKNAGKNVTTWLFDTGADTHVMPKCVWVLLGEPALQTTNVTLRRANGQDLGAMGEVQVRGFVERIKVQFKAVVARDEGYTFTLNQQGSILAQSKSGQRVRTTREGNRDTIKIVCFLKPRDTQSVTSLMLKRQLESVRRELRNIKTRQHENTRKRGR